MQIKKRELKKKRALKKSKRKKTIKKQSTCKRFYFEENFGLKVVYGVYLQPTLVKSFIMDNTIFFV